MVDADAFPDTGGVHSPATATWFSGMSPSPINTSAAAQASVSQ